MKRWFTVLLVGMLLLSVASCSQPPVQGTSDGGSNELVILPEPITRFVGTVMKCNESSIEVYTEDDAMFEKTGSYYTVYLPLGDDMGGYIVGDRVEVTFTGELDEVYPVYIKSTVSVTLLQESPFVLNTSDRTASFDASVYEVDREQCTVSVRMLDGEGSFRVSTVSFANMDFCVGDVLKVTYDAKTGLPTEGELLVPVMLRYRLRKETSVEMEATVLEICEDGMRILEVCEEDPREFYLLTSNGSDFAVGEQLGVRFSYRGIGEAPYRIQATFWSQAPVSRDKYTVWARLTAVNAQTGWADAGVYLYYTMIEEYAPFRGAHVTDSAYEAPQATFFDGALSLRYEKPETLADYRRGDYVEITFSLYGSAPEASFSQLGLSGAERTECVGISIRRLTEDEITKVYDETTVYGKYLGEDETEYAFDVDGALCYVPKAAFDRHPRFRYGETAEIVTDGILYTDLRRADASE